MRLFGSPSGRRLRLHARGAFRKGSNRARRQSRAKPYTPDELRAFKQLADKAPVKPSFVSRVLSFFKRRIM